MKIQTRGVFPAFIAFLVIAGAALGIAPAVSSTPMTIEDFDDGDISNYVFVSSSSGCTASTLTASAAAAHDGSSGVVTGQDGCWGYRDDAAVHVAQGDVLSAWVRLASAGSRAYLGFGASAAGTLSLVLAPNTGQLLFQENPGYSFTTLGAVTQSFGANKWYRAEIEWSAGGGLTGRLFDSDGSTLLNTVTASSTLYTSGGIAFRGFGGANAFDTVTLTNANSAPPVVTCEGNIRVEATGPGGGEAIWPDDHCTATDDATSDVTCAYDEASGDMFPLGSTLVTCTAIDGEGAEGTGSFEVLVVDTTDPVVTCSASPASLSPPNRKMRAIVVAVVVSDIADPAPSFTLISAVSSEPDSGLGDGDVANDIQGWATGTADIEGQLRAERGSSASGRVYTLTYEGEDTAGNTARCMTTVAVPRDQGRN